MSHKTIISICFITILAIASSIKIQAQPITVLVKVEEGRTRSWESYRYDDKRKVVFEQNKLAPKDSKLQPEPTPEPEATGYTMSDSSKRGPGPAKILKPESSILKYNKSGKLEKEEWDTNGDKVMDIYYLYHYNKKNNLFKRAFFFSDGSESYTDLYIEYYNDGKIKKGIYYIGDDYHEADYYNNKGQLIKSETVDKADPSENSYTSYTYNSGLLIKKEEHQYGEKTASHYSYDDNGRIIKYTDEDKTLKFQYDKDGKLIKKIRINDYTTITSYHYDNGSLVKKESDGSKTKYYYDKNGNLIRKEYSYNDGKIDSQTKYYYETINLK